MMTYYLLLAGEVETGKLREALATLFGLPVSEVDVAQILAADRNWEAAVLCTCEPLTGDLRWQLQITIAERVEDQPSEQRAAVFLGAALDFPVLYPAPEEDPSAYFLADAQGPPTRARIYDGADDELVINAVERPVPALPHVRVAPQPEVIRHHRMSTPITDEFRDWLAGSMYVPDSAKDPTWLAQDRLAGWESLIQRMTLGWPPDGWYPEVFYRDDLEGRDEIESMVGTLPPDIAGRLREAADLIDEAFRQGTRSIPDSDATGKGWWWRRVPEPAPWLTEPGRNATA